tara:strand:+ start:2165 stop:2413 length:249 start_codon:yes stop_codon:yes gene_type:complete
MSIWKQEFWYLNHKTLNEILPIIHIGLQEYIDKNNSAYDISSKILSYIYYNNIFESPIKIKRFIPIPNAPKRKRRFRQLLEY